MPASKQSNNEKIAELKATNQLEKMLLDNAYEALFFYNMDGKLIYVNPAFEKITGYSTAELYQENFISYVHPDDQAWTTKLWQGLFEGKFFDDVEYRIVKKNGEIRWSISSWKIVLDAMGEKIGILGKQQDITKRKLAEEELQRTKKLAEKLAFKDELTGLNNRRSFFSLGEHIVSQAKRFEHPISVIMLDVDYFKYINDTFGHAAGDKALQIIASKLQSTIRNIDIAARIGGEEFAIVLPETRADEAVKLAERIRQKIEDADIAADSKRYQVTASFGICSCHVNNQSLETMLTKADNALYIAKNNGRNQTQIHDSIEIEK